jgi:hypothetical protein
LVGTNLSEKRASVLVSPNPSNGIFEITSSNSGVIGFTITDALGRTIIHESKEIKVSTIDLSEFDAGVYILRLTPSNDSGNLEVKRLIKK